MAANSVNRTSGAVSCYPVRQAVSNGVFHGDNPTHFALPLLVIQMVVVLLVTRSIALLFKPLRQPRVLAEIIGGVMLGPSALGRLSQLHMRAIFPDNSLPLLETVANLGLLFFLFMVGLELDLHEIRRSGRMALLIAASGIALPLLGGVGVARLLLHQQQNTNNSAQMGPLIVFLAVPLSITAFPVLMRIMAERKLLGTEIGKMVVPAAAINDVFAWILLAIGVAITPQRQLHTSSSLTTPAYILLSGLAFVVFMLLVVRRFMEYIVSRHRQSQKSDVSEFHVCVTLVGVLVSGVATDAIGIHPLFGAFVFGLVVPINNDDGRSFAQACIEKIEDFVSLLMLPLFFASSGLKTDLSSINSVRAVGFLLLLVLTAGLGKITATTAVTALFLKLPLRHALTFAFLMNTKGLVELIVLNIGKDLGVFDDQTFAILVLMCLILMFFTTPAVMALYKAARKPTPYKRRKLEGMKSEEEVRVLACVHAARAVPALLHVLVACCSSSRKGSPRIKLFAMHLMELSERPSSILHLSRSLSAAELEFQLQHKYDKQESNGDEWELKGAETEEYGGVVMDNSEINVNDMMIPFATFGQMWKVAVRMVSAVSSMADMHRDVCEAAESRRATFILLAEDPARGRGAAAADNSSGFRSVNQKILQHAPCSVAVLLPRPLPPNSSSDELETGTHVAVAFFGGADDREALAFGTRIAMHSDARLTLLRFHHDSADAAIDVDEWQQQLDEQAVQEYNCYARSRDLESGSSSNVLHLQLHNKQHYNRWDAAAAEALLSAAKSSKFSLIIAGRGQQYSQENWETLLATAADPTPSILLVRQHN